MLTRALLTGAAALATLVIAAGCSNNSGDEQPSGPANTAASPTAQATTPAPSGEQHNDADVTFAQHMIPHHQQAVEMSDMVLGKQGIDPRVTELANQIKAAQGPEIEKMQAWLTQWGSPQMPMPSGMPDHGNMPMPSGDMPGHGSMPTTSGMPSMSGMPGMAGMMSEQDMEALQNAQGVEASRLFLTQMIAHHEGAITMAQTEIKDGQYPAALEMARAIVAAQQKEIDTMKGILATL
ncbi:DUF305 domain-containing protein [Mycobacterium barrassiae]|uniref:DUF305 domain-containing protein n=1 Tax=Mycobacterium barrassiae TaxID=319709 RepID=UPI002265A8A6|nr:DUF305 domain-containing protein [Mycobacterium barrassiae]MCV7298158.1 DUF305 domain-containing protein [Mycobacterium barrassiae]